MSDARDLLDPHCACDACNSRGWLLVALDRGEASIQRCDTCRLLDSDSDAVEYVAALAVQRQPETIQEPKLADTVIDALEGRKLE